MIDKMSGENKSLSNIKDHKTNTNHIGQTLHEKDPPTGHETIENVNNANETTKKGPKFVVAKDDPTKGSIINSISLFVDENKQYIQNGLYMVAFIGVIKIGHTVRAFTRFSTASKIPEQFFKDNVQLYIRVKSTDVAAYKSEKVPKLIGSHIPIFQTPFNKHSESNINLLVPGVHIDADYIDISKENLQIDYMDKKLKVRLLEKYQDECAVGEARIVSWWPARNTWVGQQLVNQGYAYVSGNCQTLSKPYINSLQKSQLTAQRTKRGIWEQASNQPSLSLVSRLKNYFNNFYPR